jgi:hypothetical protein
LTLGEAMLIWFVAAATISWIGDVVRHSSSGFEEPDYTSAVPGGDSGIGPS